MNDNESKIKEEFYRSIVNLQRSSTSQFDYFVKQLNHLAYKIQTGIAQRSNETELRWDQGKLQMVNHILSEIKYAEIKLGEINRKPKT